MLWERWCCAEWLQSSYFTIPQKRKCQQKCAMMQFLNIMKCQNSIYILWLMSVCVNIFTEPPAHPKPTIYSRLHKYKVNIPTRPVSKAVMKMNASLSPHRWILWSQSQAGHFLCDNPCQLGNWWPHLLMKDLLAPATERESQNTDMARLSRDPVKLWTLCDGGRDIRETWSQYWHGPIMSSWALSSHWSPPLILASHWPVLVFAASARYARYDLRHVSYASCSRSLDIIRPEINSIRTQPETFSFTLLTYGGFKLKSWFLTLGWWKQF